MDYTIKVLVEALRRSGRIKAKNHKSARQTVQYWIKTGKLKLRQRPTKYYIVNDDEIRDIIKEFSVRGKGYYDATEKN